MKAVLMAELDAKKKQSEEEILAGKQQVLQAAQKVQAKDQEVADRE